MNTQDKIIEAAGKLFKRYGIKSVTMDDMARELSISKKTIYQFFKDKEAIVEQATELFLEAEAQLIRQVHQEAANIIEEMYRISQSMRRTMADINPSLLNDLRKYHPQAWQRFERFKHEVVTRMLVESLEQGIKEGYLRTDLNPEILAIMRMAQVEMAFDDTVFPREQYSFGEVQVHMFEHFVHGIVTESGRALFENYAINSIES